MAKKKESVVIVDLPETFNGEVSVTKSKAKNGAITPITQEFGNGDMNTLRDKINEIIAK